MDTISSSPGQGMQQIDLTKLNLQQLTQLKQQVDQVSHPPIFIPIQLYIVLLDNLIQNVYFWKSLYANLLLLWNLIYSNLCVLGTQFISGLPPDIEIGPN